MRPHSKIALSLRQINDRRLARGGTVEGFAIFREALHEPAVAEEELSVFHAHEAVEARGFSGAVMAEAGFQQFCPLAVLRLNPLIAIAGLAKEVAVGAARS